VKFETLSRKVNTYWSCGFLAGLSLLPASTMAADAQVPAAERATLIEAIAAKLDAEYVFPNVAKEMGDAIRARAARGEYGSVPSAQLLAEKLSAVCVT
jgi:hypothetical protein